MPAIYTAYPTPAGVSAFVVAAGVTVPTAFTTAHFDTHVYAAIDEWERLTLYRPFLQPTATASATFAYDPPGPNRKTEWRGAYKKLLLDRGFLSVSSVKNGVTPDNTGSVLTAGTDYRLGPVNAPLDLRPYTSIEFVARQYGEPNSIEIVGVPGYGTAIYAEVYNAVLELAASYAMVAFAQGIGSDAVEWHEGDVSERSSIELVQKLGETWRSKARTTALQYRRLT